jgi:hypothetical protein
VIKNSDARIWINALGDCDKDLRDGKSKQALKKLLSKGATIIQTDEPEQLLRALEKYGYQIAVSVACNQMTKALFIFLYFFIDYTSVSVDAQRSIKTGLPLISAHRGASRLAPENTCASFVGAIEAGADFVEIDVRTTSDGQQVIVHDNSLKRNDRD